MHIFFVNYGKFSGPSGVHIFYLANSLSRLGVRATVFVPGDPAAVSVFGHPLFAVERLSAIRAWWLMRAARRSGENVLIHAWTPRERVRKFTSLLARVTGAKYLVHLEDNEIHLAKIYRAVAGRLPLQRRIFRCLKPNSHTNPLRMAPFLQNAAGVTCITDRLLEFCPPGKPSLVFWPGYEGELLDLPAGPDMEARRNQGLPDSAFVVVYTGNSHPANIDDLRTLYAAVAQIYAEGHPVLLLRAGQDHRLYADELGPSGRRPWLRHLGDRPHREFSSLVGLADALLQPGKSDSFNDYRFPSKIPMLLASGRPVILPHTNIGTHLVDGKECLLLKSGTAEEIADQLRKLMLDPALAAKIGLGGRAFARRHLDWQMAAAGMAEFYVQILTGMKPES